MFITHIPGAVIYSLLLLTAFTSGPVQAKDCALAETLYVQAKKEQDAGQRIDQFQRSIAACPTFEPQYMLARTYQQLQQYDKALEHFKLAEELAGGESSRAKAIARQAQIFTETDNRCQAAAHFQKSAALFERAGVARPKWLLASQKQSALAEADEVVDARTIECHLTASKSFNAVPRVNLRIHFDYDRASISGIGQAQLKELEKVLGSEKYGGYRFLLIGHTDSRGGAEYNQRLSVQRARSARASLASMNRAFSGRIDVQGAGLNQLLFPGNTDEDHRLNRRVEVRVLKY